MKEFERRSAFLSFRQLLGDVHPESMQLLSVVLLGTLGYYFRDEGGAAAVACLLALRA
jgi:hypothetical protein